MVQIYVISNPENPGIDPEINFCNPEIPGLKNDPDCINASLTPLVNATFLYSLCPGFTIPNETHFQSTLRVLNQMAHFFPNKFCEK